MKLDIEIIREDQSWEEVDIHNEYITELVEVTLNHLGYFSKANVEIAIMLTSNDHMKKLNKQFREMDKSTNVLSFPDNDLQEEDLLELSGKETYIYIGDIAIGYQILVDESREYGISFIDHFSHLLVHGVLHLLGYDHEDSQDAIQMSNLEIEILRKMNISSPYDE